MNLRVYKTTQEEMAKFYFWQSSILRGGHGNDLYQTSDSIYTLMLEKSLSIY